MQAYGFQTSIAQQLSVHTRKDTNYLFVCLHIHYRPV